MTGKSGGGIGQLQFDTTPAVMELQNGIVICEVTDNAAMRLNWRNTIATDH